MLGILLPFFPAFFFLMKPLLGNAGWEKKRGNGGHDLIIEALQQALDRHLRLMNYSPDTDEPNGFLSHD